ncbi:MAG: glutamate--tRNA ligase [Acidimicrobiia bacterium]
MRVRIAPSPTGELHVGNARAGLFNWLYARHNGGVFIVRVDDTDRERSTPEFEEENLEALRWVGLDWDEGVRVGGPHGTYRQSDRLDRYQEVATGLLEGELAYLCFCTPEDLATRRKEAQRAGRPPGYDGRCRTLPASDSAQRRDDGEPAAVRLAVPRPGDTKFEDLVRGSMEFSHEVIDDFILLRSDGTPTYHLASTVDDVDYEITHVARGEDLLSSTPKHILLTLAMEAEPPTYAHMPLLFGPDGKKLSKRHGVTSVSAYREAGYLAEAVFNYLSLLGWSFDPETTIFSVSDAVSHFDLADVSRNPAVFDPEKLTWMNGAYIRALDTFEFVVRARPFLEAEGAVSPLEWQRFEDLAPEIRERVETLADVGPLAAFLREGDLQYDEGSWSKVMGSPEAEPAVEAAREKLDAVDSWDASSIESALRSMLEDLELSARKGLQPVRVAVTGSHISPPLFESLAALGRDESLSRIDQVLDRF